MGKTGKTVTNHIRTHLLGMAGVFDKKHLPNDLTNMPQAEEFFSLMRNRLVQGAFRYGLLGDICKPTYDRLGSLINRIGNYRETGNLEHLVDAANCLLLEFVEGNHPKRHFNAEDDTEHTEVL